MLRATLGILLALTAACSPTRRWDLYEENDYFRFVGNRDRHYTQGLRLATTTKARSSVENTYSLGQSIYTPGNKRVSELIENDRPYAGWLYANYERHAHSYDHLDTLGITAGIVGPGSLAEKTQKFVHNDLGLGPDPKGWDNQLDNEAGVILSGTRKWRGSRHRVGSLDFDALPSVGVDLGNVFTQAKSSFLVRLGWRVPEDFGPGQINHRSLLATPKPKPDHWRAYLFAGTETRAVAQNIFLDGNTFSDSHSVDKYPLIGEVKIGCLVAWKDYRLSYTYVITSSEFKAQDEADRFGSINIGYGY